MYNVGLFLVSCFLYSEQILFAIERIKFYLVMTEDVSKFDEENCVICLKDFDVERPSINIGHKGLATLIQFSKRRSYKDLEHYLTVSFSIPSNFLEESELNSRDA